MKNERLKLLKLIFKISILIEEINWGAAELRSNEIAIAGQHLRDVIREFEDIPLLVEARHGKEVKP